MCGLARENIEETAGKEIRIRDGVVMVVAGSETILPGSLLVLKRSATAVGIQVRPDRNCWWSL
jgi:hypothetical protein